MRRVSPSCSRDSGAALLLALWALFLLAGVVIAWALNINSRLTVSSTANRVLSAEAMASSGAEVALNPTIKPASANLHRSMGNESYDVQMSGECGRFNLNLLAPGGVENPVLVAALRQYLNLKGVELNDLDVMLLAIAVVFPSFEIATPRMITMMLTTSIISNSVKPCCFIFVLISFGNLT